MPFGTIAPKSRICTFNNSGAKLSIDHYHYCTAVRESWQSCWGSETFNDVSNKMQGCGKQLNQIRPPDIRPASIDRCAAIRLTKRLQVLLAASCHTPRLQHLAAGSLLRIEHHAPATARQLRGCDPGLPSSCINSYFITPIFTVLLLPAAQARPLGTNMHADHNLATLAGPPRRAGT